MEYLTKLESNMASLLINRRIFIPLVLSALLIVSSQYSYLLFHSLAESFAISVALISFVVIWHTYPMTRNHFLMYLGCGYFWIASLDVIHLFAYKGMNILPFGGANQSTQYWISGRYLEAFLLFSAPLFLSRPLSRGAAFLLYGCLTIALVILIVNGYFPVAFIEGHGLTLFKIVSEYIIVAILLAAIVFFFIRRGNMDNRVLALMIASVLLTVGAEVAFTLYVTVFDLSNMVGHILKIFSYWMIFEAIVHTTLREPFRFLSQGAKTYEAIPYPTILTNGAGIILQSNIAARNIADRSNEQLIGLHCHDIFHKTGKTVNDCDICHAISRNIPLSSTMLHLPESEEYWEISLSRVDAANHIKGMVHIARNISKRRQIEEALNENENLFKVITETSPVAIAITRIDDGAIIFCNNQQGELFDLNSEDLIGRNVLDFLDDRNDRFSIINEIKRTGGITNHELKIKTASGKFSWIMMSSNVMELDGNQVMLTASTDITEKRCNEEKIIQATKLATLGEMAAGIAHELNQPLSIIRMIAENTIAGTEKGTYMPDKTIKKLTTLTNQVDRMAGIIDHMRLFSRKDNVGEEPFDPRVGIVDAVSLIDEQFKIQSIDISMDLPDTCQHVIGHPLQLEQLVLNLLSNSRSAIQEKESDPAVRNSGYVPKVEIRLEDKVEEQLVQISLIDNGGGISQKIIDKIFDPFFTTKPPGEGTGLGLSIAFSIVNGMNGSIEFRNEGEGCLVEIILPAIPATNETLIEEDQKLDEETEPEVPPISMPSEKTTNEIRILVVDDEPLAADSVAEYLGIKGFTVFQANNGEAALQVLLSKSMDAIITDLRMPVMDGNELIKKVRALDHDIPIIVTTGHSSVGEDKEVVAEGATKILKKPIELNKLGSLLGELIRPKV